MDTDRFIVYIKTEDIYSDISKGIETRFDTSNLVLDRPLTKGKNESVKGFMKDESLWTRMTRVCRTETNDIVFYHMTMVEEKKQEA